MYNFITIDFETANEKMDSPCSVGLCAVSGNEIVKTDYFLIRPHYNDFNSTNIAINGITPADVADAPAFPDVWPFILEYIQNSEYVLAHGAYFDMDVLCETLFAYDLEFHDFIYIDTINLTAPMLKSGNSLFDCASFFGVDLETAHNALCDAIACANIVLAAVKRDGAGSLNRYVWKYKNRINRRIFSELTPSDSFLSSETYEQPKKTYHVDPATIKATVDAFDEDNPFYEKICVFTGELSSIGRGEAMQAVVDRGAVLRNSVSKKTDFLIQGKQDLSLVGSDGMSSKERKAYALIRDGAKIKILNEDDFLEMLQK